MKRLMCLIAMGSLMAQDLPSGENQYPKTKEPFVLTYYDIKDDILLQLPPGKIIVDFFINERGEVEDPVIMDTFNIALNEVVLDKIRQTSYFPATQNGIPVRIRYSLPIIFK